MGSLSLKIKRFLNPQNPQKIKPPPKPPNQTPQNNP